MVTQGFKISESSWITPYNLQKHGNLHQPNTLPVLPFKCASVHVVTFQTVSCSYSSFLIQATLDDYFLSGVVPVMVVSISFLNFGRKKSGFLDPEGTVHSLYTLNQQVNSHNEIVFA